MNKFNIFSHLLTVVLSVSISAGIAAHMSQDIVQVDPKRLIDTYQAELNKSSLSVNEQSTRLVGFMQVLESTMSAYADENNVVLLVSAAVASNPKDATNEIADHIVEFYKSQSSQKEGGE